MSQNYKYLRKHSLILVLFISFVSIYGTIVLSFLSKNAIFLTIVESTSFVTEFLERIFPIRMYANGMLESGLIDLSEYSIGVHIFSISFILGIIAIPVNLYLFNDGKKFYIYELIEKRMGKLRVLLGGMLLLLFSFFGFWLGYAVKPSKNWFLTFEFLWIQSGIIIGAVWLLFASFMMLYALFHYVYFVERSESCN